MSIANKLSTIAENVPKVYAAEKAESQKRYYSDTVTLTERQTYIDLPIPFFPDVLHVMSYSDAVREVANTQINLDLRFLPATDANFGGETVHDLNGSKSSNFFGVKSGASFRSLTKNEQGYRLTAATVSGTALSFGVGEYTVVAVKLSDKSDKEMLTEYVRALPDTGETVYLSSLMRSDAFTDDEWDALIAEKPDTTFVLH